MTTFKPFEGWGIELTAKLKNSLTAKLFLVTCLLLAAVCALTYAFIAWVMPMTYTADRSHRLTQAAELLAQRLEQSTPEDCSGLLERFSAEYDAQFSITDGMGKPLAFGEDDDPPPLRDGIRTAVEASGARGQADDHAVGVAADGADQVMQTIAVSFSFAGEPDIAYQLVAVGSMEAVNQTVAALGRVWPWLLGAVLLISVLGGMLYARFVTRPIVRLSGISQKMSNLDFGWKCREDRTDEIGVLARSLNGLSQKLSAAMAELRAANAALCADIEREREQEQRRTAFFSAASHELKTPLTVLKGQLGGMLDGVGAYADRDRYLARSLLTVGRMEALVREMLTVSRIQTADTALQTQRVDLGRLMRACAEEYADLFEQKRQRLSLSLPEGVEIEGDQALLAKALRNLLANAALHSPEGAQVCADVGRRHGTVVLTVQNTGAHIPEEAIPRLFEAFYRVDPSRSRQTGGSGLGLYLVKTILDRHGAACEIRNTAEGVCAEVRFGEGEQKT